MRHRNATCLSAVLLLILTPWARSAPQSAPQYENRTVSAVTFEPAEQPVESPRLEELIGIAPGDRLRAASIHDSIERLFATGRFEDIQVDATETPAGLALRYITRGAWFVGHVSVEGDISDPPTPSQLVATVGLELGTPFDEPQLAVAEAAMLELLRENGFFNAQVTHHLAYESGRQQVRITFRVAPGKRARYEPSQFSGSTGALTERRLTRATPWRRFLLPGYRGITQNRTRDGINSIRLKYQDANHLLATVTLTALEPADGGRRATPRITINPGPVVEISALGMKIGRKQIRQNVPVFEERTVDNDLLREGAENLREYLQSRGYFDAAVRLEQSRSDGAKTVIEYSVIPGPRHRLAAISITGNRYFNTRTVRERLLLLPTSFEQRAGRYSEALRRRDEQAITELYRSNGFRDVKVSSRVTDDYAGRESDLQVVFTIEEGSQQRIAALDIQGANRLNLAQFAETLSSQRGQIFSEVNIAADRDAILRHYGNSGFPAATFRWSSAPGPEPNTVNLRFLITEGEREFIREVVISGLSTTRPALVNRQLSVAASDPLSPSALADTQRRLYDLGIFAQVNLAIQNPDGEERRRTVLYDVEEASRYSITTGFGAEFARLGGNNAITDLSNPGGAPGFSPRFSFNVSRLNFLGRGQTVGFQSRLSILQKRAVATYFVPRVFGFTGFDATASAMIDDTRAVGTFQSRRKEASIQIVQRVSRSLTSFYRYTYRNVSVGNLKIDPLLLPRLAQDVRAGIASFNLVQDRRDDPVEPRRGVYNTLDVGVASRIFGSGTSFVRLLGRNATYHRITDKIIFARETQLGFEPAFNLPPGADPRDPIPLPERFFGGGGNTLRGVPENQAGPRDLLTGFPLGGAALFFNNTELRFPLLGANVNGVLFEDAGNIFSAPSAISFRTRQRGLTDFNYMVHAAGFGLRYKTPVGPIRVDLAYSINPPAYSGFAGSYTQLVACSQVGTCQSARQQISHFQFYFSIGQAF